MDERGVFPCATLVFSVVGVHEGVAGLVELSEGGLAVAYVRGDKLNLARQRGDVLARGFTWKALAKSENVFCELGSTLL